MPKVEEYVEEYDNLIELRYHVRQDILMTQDEINRSYKEKDFNKLEVYKKILANLLAIDKNICDCVNGDHLEKLLQN